MNTLYVEPVQKSEEVFALVRAAIAGQIARFELGVQLARQRLATFEQKYDVTSAVTIQPGGGTHLFQAKNGDFAFPTVISGVKVRPT